MITRYDALNDALERFQDYAFLDGPGFAFHGPMGAETLSTLGHDDLIAGWASQYRSRNEPIAAPPASNPLNPADTDAVGSALGDPLRVSDWAAMFRAQLWEQPWADIVRQWAPRLIAGYAGALTHGLIRTAHAVRAMPTDGAASRLQLDELAKGLALWAATYRTLPGHPELRGTLELPEAVAGLPRPNQPWSIPEAGGFTRIDELDNFPQAVRALAKPSQDNDALSLLSAQFCRVIIAYPEAFPIPLVHTVTPIAAVRSLLPYLPAATVDSLYAQLWHVGAAITVSFTPSTPARANENDTDTGTVDDLAASAVAHQDTHVMKFSEACAREYALNPDPVYLAAAHQVMAAVPKW